MKEINPKHFKNDLLDLHHWNASIAGLLRIFKAFHQHFTINKPFTKLGEIPMILEVEFVLETDKQVKMRSICGINKMMKCFCFRQQISFTVFSE